MRLHYATGVRWIRLSSVGWEVWVQVAMAEGNNSLIMGASTKGVGHYMWTSVTLLVFERAKDMVFGQGVGGWRCVFLMCCRC